MKTEQENHLKKLEAAKHRIATFGGIASVAFFVGLILLIWYPAIGWKISATAIVLLLFALLSYKSNQKCIDEIKQAETEEESQ